MAYTERGNFRRTESSYQSDEVYMFYTIDRPIYEEQIDLLWLDLNRAYEVRSRPRTRGRQQFLAWWTALESVSHDGYGSFRLNFDTELWDKSTDQELAQYHQDIEDILNTGAFRESIISLDGFEQDSIDSFLESGWELDDLFDCYCATHLACGYAINQVDVEQWVEGHLTPQQVEARLLPRLIRGENIRMRDVATV